MRNLKFVIVAMIFGFGIALWANSSSTKIDPPVKDKVHVLEYYEIQHEDNIRVYFLHVYDPEGVEGTSFEYLLFVYNGVEVQLLRTYRGKERL